MRHGRAEMSLEVTEEETQSRVRDADHLALVRRLSCKSHLCVPMVARGRTLGVISFVGTRASRRFDPHDLSLAEELARRAAAAADNARMYREMERARLCSEDASRAKDRLLATLSHELRTPLTPVLLTLGALLDDPGTPDPIRQQLEEGLRGVELEARLIDDLLDATRAGTGKLRLERRYVDVHTIVREALATCGEVIRLAGLRLELDLMAPRRFLEADPARLQQVVWNLVKNSAKFTPTGGTITVRSREVAGCECQGEGGACLRIEVSDTGAGIERDLLGSIFEPFEQGGAARGEQSGGLGLGLAIARGIAEAHGGRLTASSGGKGLGATFTLELPLSADATTVAAIPSGTPVNHATEGARLMAAPLRILLVEDDAPTRTVLSRLLILRGNHVATAATLAEARATIEREPFDLVVSDLGLPDGSGLELGAWLSVRSGIPSLALSGYGSVEDRVRSREAGFAAHLTKPVNFGILEETIQRIRPISKPTLEPIALP
jgi:signal transduction histidine kinase/ActR/RegA family two-component response regulator